MSTEVKFTIPVPTLDALRRIVKRDYEHDVAEHKRIMGLPEAERPALLRAQMRNESDRDQVARSLGFQEAKDERGE